MELRYEDLTQEQIEIYNAVKRAYEIEDLKCVLEDDYERNISEFSEHDIDLILDKYKDYREDSGAWREDMHFAINRILGDY